MAITEIRPGQDIHPEVVKPGYVKKVLPFAMDRLLPVIPCNAPPTSTTINEIKDRSHGHDSAWIGWQVNRAALGAGAELTGFEPYFIGQELSPVVIGEQINHIGQTILRPLAPRQKNEVLRTMGDGDISFDALLYLYGQFGATLSTLRAGIARNPKAISYRNETSTLCQNLGIHYPQTEANVRIHALPKRGQVPPEIVRPAVLDTTGFELMNRIGKLGDPLLWQALALPSDSEIARRYNRFAFGR